MAPATSCTGSRRRWAHEDAQPIIKVKVVDVHDDGRAEIEGDDLKLTLW
jgi:hypothetical protein